MPEPARIRNVAVVGHRGTGKTSLLEALLYQSGAINRLGTVEAGTTISDSDEDEHKRQLSIAMALAHATWQDRKLNLIDVPGDPSFQGELRTAARVVEGMLVTVSAVMGVEVGTSRAWRLGDELGLARLVFVNMLDRERADFFRTLEQLRSQLSTQCVAVHIPIGSEHELTGIVDVLHMCAYTSPEGGKEGEPGPIPDEMAAVAAEYREKLLDSVVETDEGLMERYLDGQELGAEEVASALKEAVTRGEVFPVACGVATKNLGPHALLDLLVEGVPSPAKKGSPIDVDGASSAVFVFKTVADPFAGRINLFRVLKGSVAADTTLVNLRAKSKERMGTLLEVQGKDHKPALDFVEGDIGAVAKLKEAQTGDLLTDREVEIEVPDFGFPEPVMSFAITPKAKGDEEKVATAIRRLAEEDPTLRLRRDQQTGEEILSGMSQMHVEVALERAKRRFGVDVELHPPRVPYRETIRREARAHARYKKQTGGRGQFGDCHIVVSPFQEGEYEFVDRIVGGVIPQSFRPAVNKGIQEAMQRGELAGAPVQGVRVELVDGSYHTVDSSEMAFKIAGSMAWQDATLNADPVLLEPIMELEVTVPDDAVGPVNGDLNSRRGRLHGMEPLGGMTTIKAEVPMAELLTYAQSLTSMTGGRGDYSMHFLRYEEVPAHVAQKIIEDTKRERETAKA
ncbi:MAG TPA: elongation factor G [Gaiellaceae bacterium]|nr:elongation factor G [Gaiellaceae bacterium]